MNIVKISKLFSYRINRIKIFDFKRILITYSKNEFTKIFDFKRILIKNEFTKTICRRIHFDLISKQSPFITKRLEGCMSRWKMPLEFIYRIDSTRSLVIV